jgi:redox-sensing transcriptional repressor
VGKDKLPRTTIQRLPMYLRVLLELEEERRPLVNSVELAERCGTNAAQVRKDLSYLGELGTRGIGYDVEALVGHISEVLGIAERRRAALIGFGRFGGALLGYSGFPERGFEIVAVFDVDPAKVGQRVQAAGRDEPLTVLSVDDLEREVASRGVEIAIMATPARVTQQLVDRVVAAGIKAVLNLAPVSLVVPDDVTVRQVCLSTDLQVLSFHLARGALEDAGSRPASTQEGA